MLSLLLAGILLLSGAAAGGNSIIFQHFDSSTGLSHNSVNCITQDSQGSMWFGTKYGLNRYNGQDNTVYYHSDQDCSSLPDDNITAIVTDREGRVWVATPHGLARFARETNRFERVSGFDIEIQALCLDEKSGHIIAALEYDSVAEIDPSSGQADIYRYCDFGIEKINPECIFADSKGRIWIGTFSQGLFYFDSQRRLHSFGTSEGGQNPFISDSINRIIETDDGDILTASFKAGVCRISSDGQEPRRLLQSFFPGKEIMCRSLSKDARGQIIIGSESGLFIISSDGNHCSHYVKSYTDKGSISDNAIYATYVDDCGGLWIGSYFGGIDYSTSPFSPISRYYPSKEGTGLHSERIREMCQDDDGKIWIGTEDNGLYVFLPDEERFEHIAESRKFHNVHGLKMKDGLLWVSSFGNGIWVINPRTRKIVRSFVKGVNCPSLVDNTVFTLETDGKGELYIGTFYGIQKYDSRSDSFEKVDCTDLFTLYLKSDSKGNMWAATAYSGLFRRDSSSGEWKHFRNNPADETSLPSDAVASIFEDSSGQIWILTADNGMARYSDSEGSFVRFNRKNGFPEERLRSMQEGRDGKLWISSERGLIVFNASSGQYRVLRGEDGLLSDSFNYQSSLCTSEGKMYFGTIHGLISFFPEEITFSERIPKAFIAELRKNGETVALSPSGSRFKAEENNLSIAVDVVAIHSSKSWTLEYRLDGIDHHWMTLGSSDVLNYPKLHHGNYAFELRARSRSGGISRLQSYPIKILPHWHETLAARIGFVLLALALASLVIIFVRRQSYNRFQMNLAEIRQKQDRELYESKMKFYTDIAHEIRTPVTLINGPLDNILKKDFKDPETVEDLKLMKRSTDKLTTLVNDLMDFRKFESGAYILHFSRQNIVAIVMDICNSFSYCFKDKGLDFRLDCSDEELYADIDFDGFTNMVTNLISNGCKYSSSYLRVEIARDATGAGLALIRVINDGDLIPPDKREAIFQPFVRYRSSQAPMEPGSGIGLVLARSMAELHGGSLVVEESSLENIFRLTVPLLQETASSEESEVLPAVGEEGKQKTILIVEDQIEMNNFLKRELGRKFTICQAFNGKEALSVLDSTDIDLIVSDVSMPVMDGMLLCRQVKENVSYSHIPFILLTAMTATSNKIEAMNSGADAYIDKPFNMDFLKAAIDNLLQKRKIIHEAARKGDLSAAGTEESSTADREFIGKLKAIIAENYSDPEFRLDEVYSMMDMSKSNFYRKMKGAINMTPNDLLRIERLNKAAELLRSGQYRVNEVCYMVGFSTPSYFTSCFQKQFGVSPKDFISAKK